METPKEETEPAEAPTPPDEGGESYEDSWYQVLKRRAKETPEAPSDDETSED